MNSDSCHSSVSTSLQHHTRIKSDQASYYCLWASGPMPAPCNALPQTSASSCSLNLFRPLFKCHLFCSSLFHVPTLTKSSSLLGPAHPARPTRLLSAPLPDSSLQALTSSSSYTFLLADCLFSLMECNSLRTRSLSPYKHSTSKGLSP